MSAFYAPFYCEENIWHLCGERRFSDRRAVVVVVSNQSRTCALWAQRAAPRALEPVIWDYHVILGVREPSGWVVWDPDTTLEAPTDLGAYLGATFLPLPSSLSALAPRFRLIAAARYRADFSSDRAHMRSSDGRWSAPPPAWPPIVREGKPSFLSWTMMPPDDPEVVSLDELRGALEGGC